jgi:hypothetical protein
VQRDVVMGGVGVAKRRLKAETHPTTDADGPPWLRRVSPLAGNPP